MPQIDPDEVRRAAGWNPEYQPQELDRTVEEIRRAAEFRAPTWIGKAGKGLARGAGQTALGMARMLVTPPSDPTALTAGTFRMADFFIKQKKAAEPTPRLTKQPLYGPFSALNYPEKLERIGRIFALPIDVAGLPLSETAEKLGRGPYYPEELGEAAGTIAVFGALGRAGRGVRARPGAQARVAEAAPKAKAQYRVIPDSEIPRAPSGRRIEPGPPPDLWFRGKKVKRPAPGGEPTVKPIQRPDVGGVKQPQVVRVEFEDGTVELFDAREFVTEAGEQIRAYERGEAKPPEAPREAPPPEPEVGAPPPKAEARPGAPPPRAEPPRPGEAPPRAEAPPIGKRAPGMKDFERGFKENIRKRTEDLGFRVGQKIHMRDGRKGTLKAITIGNDMALVRFPRKRGGFFEEKVWLRDVDFVQTERGAPTPAPGEPPPGEPAPSPPGRQPPLRTEPVSRRGPFKGPRGEVELVRGPEDTWSVIKITRDPSGKARREILQADLPIWEARSRAYRAVGTGYPTKVTPEGSQYLVYRGYGRKRRAAAYGPKWSPELGAIMGDDVTYWAFDKETAGRFGPKIDEQTIVLKNPLVLRNNAEWKEIAQSVDEYPDFITRKETFGGDFGPAKASRDKIIAEIKRRGHDGIVVTPAALDEFGGRNALSTLFGDPQVVSFKPRPVEAEPVTVGAPPPSAEGVPMPPTWPKVPKDLKGKERNAYIAERLTPEQISAIHQGLRQLARVDDGALRLDGVGFNKMDTRVGQELAGQSRLSPKQAALAGSLIRKYKGQLEPELYESIYGPRAKESWEMTPEEYSKSVGSDPEAGREMAEENQGLAWMPQVGGTFSKKPTRSAHRKAVERALKAGKDVPEEATRFYPDLRLPEAKRKAWMADHRRRFMERNEAQRAAQVARGKVRKRRLPSNLDQFEGPGGIYRVFRNTTKKVWEVQHIEGGGLPRGEVVRTVKERKAADDIAKELAGPRVVQPLETPPPSLYKGPERRVSPREAEAAWTKEAREAHLRAQAAGEAAPGPLPPAPEPRPEPVVVKPPRKVAGFNPEKHSLASFVFKAKIKLGRTGSPEMIKRLPGKGRGYRSEKIGMDVDTLIQSAREDGQFPIPEDIRLDDFIDLVAQDAWARKKGESKGRIWSNLRQEFKPPSEITERPPADIAPRVPTIKELAVELKEAKLSGDLRRVEEIEERIAIMQEQNVTKGDLDWPFNLDIPLGGRPKRSITDRLKDEGGFFNLRDLFRANRPPQRPSPTVSDAYQSVLDAREAMGKTPRIRVLDWMTDMGVEFYRQVFDKHVRLYRAINEMTDRRQMELIHKYDPAVVIPLVQGGTGARVHAALLTLSKARKGAVADGLLPEVTRYLDFKGWLRGYRILQEKADAAFQRGDLDGYQQYMQKIREGEGMPAGYTPERIQAELEEMMSSLPEADRLLVDQHAQKVWEVGRTYWDLLHETGIISDAVHQQGINRGPEYIPLHRIIDDLRNDPDWGYVGVFNAATLKSLNKLEGSARATVDPYEAMYTWATKALTDAGKNEVLSTVHGLKALDPGGLFDEAIVNLKAGQKPPHGMSKLTYRQKGRKVSFAMDSMLAASIKNASPKDVSLVHGFMQVFRRTLQVGAVSGNLAFTPRNLMRDWAEMMALSDAGSPINPVAFGRIVHRLAQSAYHILMRDESYLQFLNERAANSIMTKAIDPGYWVADVPWRKKSLWKRVKGVPMAPLRGVMEITAFSEELTKMTAWLELRKRGWSPERAAAEVRTYAGTPDFFVHGTNTEALNLAVMFFAVRQQGKLRIWRKVRKMPKKLLSLIAVSALTSLALFRHNSQYRDKDGNPEWDHVPEDVKRNYWVILSDEIDPVTGRHAQYTIRKAETLQVFYNPIERATWEVVGGQLTADDYWQAVTDFGTAAVPFFPEIDIENENALNGTLRSTVSSLNPVFKEPIEQAMNYDTYRRIPIVPRGEEDLDPRFQYSPFTSPTAIAAGKRMPPWAPEWARSPRRIEHAIRGVFAGVGEQALSIADFPAYETEVGRTIGPEDRRPFRGIEDVPVLGPVTRSAYRSRPRDKVLDDMQERFYRYYRESETIVRTLNDRYKSGDAEGAQRYIAEAPERRMLYDYNGVFRKIATTLSQLRDQRNAVVMDVETPEKDRTEEAKKIYQRQLRLLYIAEGIHENVLKVKGEMPEESKPTGPIGSPPPDLLRQLPPR